MYNEKISMIMKLTVYDKSNSHPALTYKGKRIITVCRDGSMYLSRILSRELSLHAGIAGMILDAAKVEKCAGFMVAKEPVNVDGRLCYRIILDNPIPKGVSVRTTGTK